MITRSSGRLSSSPKRRLNAVVKPRWSLDRNEISKLNNKKITNGNMMPRSLGSTLLNSCNLYGFEGLEDQQLRPLKHPVHQLSLLLFNESLSLQQAYPRAGGIPMHR